MNLPNTLTLLRIFFVPVFVAAMVQEPHSVTISGFSLGTDTLALLAFLAAALTDLLDGYLARKWHQITTVGTLLDPIADKLLISAALISLVQVQVVPGWMAILIIGREFAISGLRSIAAAEGYVIQASDMGKTKLVTQVIAVALGIISMRNTQWRPLALFWMWCVVFFALVSAVLYFRKFWRRIDVEVKRRRRRELIAMERAKIRNVPLMRGKRTAWPARDRSRRDCFTCRQSAPEDDLVGLAAQQNRSDLSARTDWADRLAVPFDIQPRGISHDHFAFSSPSNERVCAGRVFPRRPSCHWPTRKPRFFRWPPVSRFLRRLPVGPQGRLQPESGQERQPAERAPVRARSPALSAAAVG